MLRDNFLKERKEEENNIKKYHWMWDIAFLEQIPLYLAWKSPEESAIELEKTTEKLRNRCKTNPFLL